MDFKEGSAIKTGPLPETLFPEAVVKQRMKQVLHAHQEDMDAVLDHVMAGRGKMLRPQLVYLSAAFYSHKPQVVCDVAIAVELIHLASLIHDDIIDHALLRRGLDSVNRRWGEKISVLSGDYLFAAAFNLISRLDRGDILKNLTQTIKIMCLGEIKQLKLACHWQVDREAYFEKTFQKTACLFASACRCGALASAMPSKLIGQVEQFGLYLGYAYQLLDDILDWVADTALLGKPVGADLLEGNITLPVIIALEDPRYGPELKTILEQPDQVVTHIYFIQARLEACRALETALQYAYLLTDLGLNVLRTMPDSPAAEGMQQLSASVWEYFWRQNNRLDRGALSYGHVKNN